MLAALTPSPQLNQSIPGTTSSTINQSMPSRLASSSANLRPNGSSFGWGNRERKMEENWRLQHRNPSK